MSIIYSLKTRNFTPWCRHGLHNAGPKWRIQLFLDGPTDVHIVFACCAETLAFLRMKRTNTDPFACRRKSPLLVHKFLFPHLSFLCVCVKILFVFRFSEARAAAVYNNVKIIVFFSHIVRWLGELILFQTRERKCSRVKFVAFAKTRPTQSRTNVRK